MRAGVLVLAGAMVACVPPLPRERPADFSVAVMRSAMTKPTALDRWTLDAQGWTFGDETKGPATPAELDTAYRLVREARIDLMRSQAREGEVFDGQVEHVVVVIAGTKTGVTVGSRYELVRGNRPNYTKAIAGLTTLATAAYARLRPPP